MKTHNRKLLSPSVPTLEPTTKTLSTPPGRPSTLTEAPIPEPYQSSLVLAALAVLAIALFLLSLFSICMRRFSDNRVAEFFSRRRRQRSSQRTSYFTPSDLPTRSNLRPGVDQAKIRALPVYSYGGNEKYEIIDCAICLSEFQEKEAVKVIPFCKHLFHPQCIDTWLSSHGTCPVCRSTRLFDEVNGGTVGLGAKQGVISESGTERSMVENHDTCVEERVVESVGFCLRRNRSCSSLGERTTLARTSSF